MLHSGKLTQWKTSIGFEQVMKKEEIEKEKKHIKCSLIKSKKSKLK